MIQSGRTACQEVVVHKGCHSAHQHDNSYVLSLVREGRAADGVPLHAVAHGLTIRQAVEVKVAFIIVTGAEVRPALQLLRAWEWEG